MSETPLSAYATSLDEARGVIDRLERELAVAHKITTATQQEAGRLRAELDAIRAAIFPNPEANRNENLACAVKLLVQSRNEAQAALLSANKGAERNAHINASLADQLKEARAALREAIANIEYMPGVADDEFRRRRLEFAARWREAAGVGDNIQAEGRETRTLPRVVGNSGG